MDLDPSAWFGHDITSASMLICIDYEWKHNLRINQIALAVFVIAQG
jgi:hypothetical protein